MGCRALIRQDAKLHHATVNARNWCMRKSSGFGIWRIDPAVKLSEIAVLCRTHAPLEKMRAICDVEALPCEIAEPEAAKGQISLMRTREGWALAQALRRRQVRMVRLGALRRQMNRQRRAQPRSAALQDLQEIVEDLASTLPADIIPAAEVLELFYEAAGEMRRDGRTPS